MVHQLSTLLKKNAIQLKHHYCNSICNIINPLVWLFVIYLAKQMAEVIIIQSLPILKTDVPVIYNIPLYAKLKYSNISAKTTNCEEWYLYDFDENLNDSSRDFFEELIGSKNMLRSFCNDNPQQFNTSPYFRTPQEAKINDTEKTINDYLYNRGVDLNRIDIKEISKEKVLHDVPEGAITVNLLNETLFYYTVQVRDYLVSFYHRGSGVTLFYIFNENSKGYEILPSAITGIAWEIGIMNKAYMHKVFPNITVFSGLQILPIGPEDNEVNVQKVASIVTSGIYPFVISLLMPLFIYTIVNEKDKKIFQFLKINGLKMRYYWISNFIVDFCIYAITALLFVIFEIYVFKLRFFGESSTLLIILTFLGWGFSQIGLSYFFQAFISKEKISTVLFLSFYFFISFALFCLNMALFVIPLEAPWILNILPTFAFIRIFHYITFSCGFQACISEISSINTELKLVLFFLFFDGILYGILGILLNSIFVKRNKEIQCFCIDNKDEKFQEKLNRKQLITNIEEDDFVSNEIDIDNNKIDNDNIIKTNVSEKEKDNNYELNKISMDIPLNDDEVLNEIEGVKNIVNSGEEKLKEYPFICNLISDENRKYLNNFSLSVKKNEIFGIIDSNKTNKASFYSILNNIFYNNNDNIYINGYEIKYNMEKLNELIGLCPKNNILWDDLTVKETLYFYSEIKNSKKGKTKIRNMVNLILTKTYLEGKKNKLVGSLNEIMKRRLAIGIALIGEPAIIFLDEPTKGLNPENKIKIWNILKSFKEETSMIIVSHTMDEIQNVCDRVGIVSNGSLKYLGNPYKFISTFSKDYKLEIKLNYKKKHIENKEIITNINNEERLLGNKEEKNKIKELMQEIFPKGCCLIEEYLYNISFKIRYDVLNVNKLFEKLQEVQEQLQIDNWVISKFTFDDIFIKLIDNN